jgi:hypothetical protein
MQCFLFLLFTITCPNALQCFLMFYFMSTVVCLLAYFCHSVEYAMKSSYSELVFSYCITACSIVVLQCYTCNNHLCIMCLVQKCLL